MLIIVLIVVVAVVVVVVVVVIVIVVSVVVVVVSVVEVIGLKMSMKLLTDIYGIINTSNVDKNHSSNPTSSMVRTADLGMIISLYYLYILHIFYTFELVPMANLHAILKENDLRCTDHQKTSTILLIFQYF